MANPYTLELLMQGALDRADMLRRNATTGVLEATDFIDAGSVAVYVNAELAVLWDALISANEDYCIKHLTIEVLSDTEDYSLPSDFYKFRKVFPILSGKRRRRLKKFDLNRLGESDSLAAILTSRIEETEYRISGNRLWLHPKPTNVAELEMWYIPQFDPILNLGDKIDFRYPVGWEQYVIEGVAARLLEKEESDSSAQIRRQEKILQRITVMAEDRDVGEPHVMQDTEGYLR